MSDGYTLFAEILSCTMEFVNFCRIVKVKVTTTVWKINFFVRCGTNLWDRSRFKFYSRLYSSCELRLLRLKKIERFRNWKIPFYFIPYILFFFFFLIILRVNNSSYCFYVLTFIMTHWSILLILNFKIEEINNIIFIGKMINSNDRFYLLQSKSNV